MHARTWLGCFIAAGFVAFGGAAQAIVTHFHGTSAQETYIVNNTAAFATSSSGFVAVPSAGVDINAPAGWIIRVQFSAESTCGGESGSKGSKCSLRAYITPGGVPAFNPKSGFDFGFDSYDGNCCSDTTPEAHSMEWTTDPFDTATFATVRIQAATADGVTLTLDDWTMIVDSIPPCCAAAH